MVTSEKWFRKVEHGIVLRSGKNLKKKSLLILFYSMSLIYIFYSQQLLRLTFILSTYSHFIFTSLPINITLRRGYKGACSPLEKSFIRAWLRLFFWVTNFPFWENVRVFLSCLCLKFAYSSDALEYRPVIYLYICLSVFPMFPK